MDSSSEKPEVAPSTCPHCGRPVGIADSSMRRRLADSEHYQATFSRVTRMPECVPIEELRTDGLV